MNPADTYYLNIDKINIENWNTFLENNKAIESRLENMNINIGYTQGFIDYIKTTSDTAYKNLQKIENETVKQIGKITEAVPQLESTNTRLKEKLAAKSIQIMTCLNYAELEIDAYNNGTTVDENIKASVMDILKGHITDTDYFNAGLLSIEFSPATAGLLYSSVDDPNLIKIAVSTGGKKLLEQVSKGIWDVRMTEVLKGSGIFADKIYSGVAVASYFTTFISDRLADEGDFTEYDNAYRWADAAQTATVATFASMVGTLVGGATFGPLGLLVTAGINFAARPLIEKISEIAAGETVMDTFTYNGETYTIKKNGAGRKETGDVYIDRMNSAILINKSRVGWTPVGSTEVFKKQMYTDTENFVETAEEFRGGFADQSEYTEEGYAYIHNKNDWNTLKSKIKSASSSEEANRIYNDYYENSAPEELKHFMRHMKNEYGFSASEWWKSMQ